MLNYKQVLQDINIEAFKNKPPDCTCAISLFIHNPACHVMNIVHNTSLRSVLSKGPQYRDQNISDGKSHLKY